MRLGSRNDVVLLGGLAVALFVGLSRRIGDLLDYAHQIDRNTGLQLLPALIILTGVFILHLVRKRQQLGEETRLATTHVAEMERLVAFSQALARSLDLSAIKAVAVDGVPALVPGRGLWVASRALSLEEPEAGDVATLRFPLTVAGAPVGVIGVPPGPPLSGQQRSVLVAAAALLAVSIKNAELFHEVHEHSVRDSLTGCHRRKHALEVMDAELKRARRSKMPLSLIMFDLDHFKAINDGHGHLCGDAVLAAVGQRMNAVLRGSDVKCRYGGEEFLVLLPDTPLAGARHVADTLRRELEQHPLEWKGKTIGITASFGVTAIVPAEDSTTAVIDRADAALYRAKAEGRNCIRVDETILVDLSV